jgi:hypothetical protein
MSKFIDKLDKITKGDIQAMGFAASVSRSSLPQMLTVASMRFEVVAGPLPSMDADAIVLCIDDLSKSIESLEHISKEQNTGIWGVELDGLSNKEAERLTKIGCDFIVLRLTGSSTALMCDEKLGKLIEISPTMDDSLIRTINLLSVDAVIVEEKAEAKEITVERLMIYNRITAIVQKPVLLSLPPKLAKEHLEVLSDIGIKGLLLDWTDKTTDKKIFDIKKAINALPKIKKKKTDKGRLNATLPDLTGGSHDDEEDSEQ